MKKIVAVILAVVMVSGLCACNPNKSNVDYVPPTGEANTTPSESSSAPTSNPTDDTATDALEPTEEERDVLYAYANYALILKEEDYYQQNQESRERYYHELMELDFSVIDKWKDKDFITYEYLKISSYTGGIFAEEIDWDYTSLISCYAVIPNVELYTTCTTTDHLDNVMSVRCNEKHYNVDGTFHRPTESAIDEGVLSHRFESDVFYRSADDRDVVEYDSEGRLLKIKNCQSNTNEVYRIRSFVYDENGRVSQEIVKTNSSEYCYIYSYDENGRLSNILRDGINYYLCEAVEKRFSYDEAGRLIKEERIEYNNYDANARSIYQKEIMEYTYDANGMKASAVHTYQKWNRTYPYLEQVDHHTYTNDEQGRMLTDTVVYGDTYYCDESRYGQVTGTPQYAQAVYEIVYGDYIAFDWDSTNEN